MSNPEQPNVPGTPEAPMYAAPAAPAAPGVAPQQPLQQAPMNTLALVAFIGSFFVSLVGIICGHIALKQTKRDGTRGRGFALAGTIIGYVALAAQIVGVIIAIVSLAAAASLVNTAATEYESQSDTTDSYIAEEAPLDDTSADVVAGSDFCSTLDEITQKSMSGDVTNADFAEGYARLSMYAPTATGSDLYSQLSEYSLDPTSLMSDPNFDPTAFQSEVQAQLTTDAMDCL